MPAVAQQSKPLNEDAAASAVADRLLMKSRERVRTYGEVFTPRHMVDRMLDLVKDDLEDGPGFVDKTFLEPAAGDGNFLVAILQRKLSAITRRFPDDVWTRESLFALASIYGIELLEDNHQDAQAAMLAEFVRFHAERGGVDDVAAPMFRAATFLIGANVVCGNMLTGKNVHGDDIEFSWWHRVAGAPGLVRREPFTFSAMRFGAIDFGPGLAYAERPIDEVHLERVADA